LATFAQATSSTMTETPASQTETLASLDRSSGPRAVTIGPLMTVASESLQTPSLALAARR
jgi:hypothetical protein